MIYAEEPVKGEQYPREKLRHDNADSAYEYMKFVMENAKNAKDFKEGNPFYVLGIHGGKDYRETTANIAQKDARMKGFAPSNFGVYEYKNGSVTEKSHDSLENQRYFVIISIPMSGQLVLIPVNGYYEKNGEEDVVIPLDVTVGALYHPMKS